MPRKKKKEKIVSRKVVKRNPLIKNPLYRKSGKHNKKSKRDLQNDVK